MIGGGSSGLSGCIGVSVSLVSRVFRVLAIYVGVSRPMLLPLMVIFPGVLGPVLLPCRTRAEGWHWWQRPRAGVVIPGGSDFQYQLLARGLRGGLLRIHGRHRQVGLRQYMYSFMAATLSPRSIECTPSRNQTSKVLAKTQPKWANV